MCNLFIDKIYLPGQLAGIYEVYSDQLSERKGLAGMPDVLKREAVDQLCIP